MREKTILLTNDDGLASPSLEPMQRELSEFARVVTVVPESQRSWIGKAITRHSPVRVRRMKRDFHAISGTPADCVQLGVFHLFREKPALIVSGINLGENIGISHFFSSGTIGATIEGAILGVKGVAFSRRVRFGRPENSRNYSWAAPAKIAGKICRDLLGKFPEKADLINVNFPESRVSEKTPWKITSLTNLKYGSIFRRSGREFHNWGGVHKPEFGKGTDALALKKGFISITPVKLSLEIPRIRLAQPSGRMKKSIEK
ncbi:MAG: 5'/3'-nucleotidase SurE [archaeon]